MAFTVKIDLTVTDEETGVDTVDVSYAEKDVSVEKTLELEEDLMGALVSRFDKQKGKMLKKN